MNADRMKQLARRIGRLESRIFSLELRKGEAYRELRELSKIRRERICSHCGTEENVDWCSNCDQYECAEAPEAGGPVSVLESKLNEFRAEMVAKFKRRAEKYPEEKDNIVSDNFDWFGYPIDLVEIHLLKEFMERFPRSIQHVADLTTYDFNTGTIVPIADDALSNEEKMKEDIDIANLAFADWAIRKARAEKEENLRTFRRMTEEM